MKLGRPPIAAGLPFAMIGISARPAGSSDQTIPAAGAHGRSENVSSWHFCDVRRHQNEGYSQPETKLASDCTLLLGGILPDLVVSIGIGFGVNMQKNAGKRKMKCKNCEGKGLFKQGDKKVKCQRCGGTGYKS
jgi:hypothetical protein